MDGTSILNRVGDRGTSNGDGLYSIERRYRNIIYLEVEAVEWGARDQVRKRENDMEVSFNSYDKEQEKMGNWIEEVLYRERVESY